METACCGAEGRPSSEVRLGRFGRRSPPHANPFSDQGSREASQSQVAKPTKILCHDTHTEAAQTHSPQARVSRETNKVRRRRVCPRKQETHLAAEREPRALLAALPPLLSEASSQPSALAGKCSAVRRDAERLVAGMREGRASRKSFARTSEASVKSAPDQVTKRSDRLQRPIAKGISRKQGAFRETRSSLPPPLSMPLAKLANKPSSHTRPPALGVVSRVEAMRRRSSFCNPQ